MEKGIILLAVLVLAFLTPTVVAIPVDESGALCPIAGGIGILSPSNGTYGSTLLTLKVAVTALVGGNIYISMDYSLDRKTNVPIPLLINHHENSFQATITGSVSLPELSEGSHSITVYAKYDLATTPPHSATDNVTVYFTIDSSSTFTIDKTSPTISNLSLENKTYNSAELPLPLSFTIDKAVSWLAYCIDNQANTTIARWYNPDIYGKQFNTTLKGLSPGSHSIVVYAIDTAGNTGVSEIIYFSVAPAPSASPSPTEQSSTSPSPAATSHSSQLESFPKTIVIASISSVAVVGVVLLVYFKKHR